MYFRSGYYVLYEGAEYRLLSLENFEIVSYDSSCVKLGFTSYESGFPYFKKLDRSDIISAYRVRTKARYKGFNFELEENETLEKGKVRLWLNTLDFEAFDYFGFNYREEAFIVINVVDLDDIWEEREKLSNFPFNVDKIRYLKSKSTD